MKVNGDLVVSTVDGPGRRVVLHTAGCGIKCPGCFNPHTHSKTGPNVRVVHPQDLAIEMATKMAETDSVGVTISGGEPTDQLMDLIIMCKMLRSLDIDSITLYTGRLFTGRVEDALRYGQGGPLVDVVIDGAYIRRLHETGNWQRGSSNQRIITLTSRHTVSEFESREAEVIINEGKFTVLGFPDADMIDEINKLRN